MVQRKVIVRGATDQALDELDAADIPDLSAVYETAGGIATHEAAGNPHAGYATDGDLTTHAGTAHGLSSHAIDGAFHSGVEVLPTAGQKNALAGTAGTPGTGNEYVTEQDVRLTDDRDPTAHSHLDADIPAGIARDTEVATAVSDHAALADPHAGYRLESADHSHASTGAQAGTVSHDVLTDVSANDHHPQTHAADHLPTGADPVNKFVQSTIGTLDQAIANTETVVLAKVFAANELAAGQVYRFEAWFTKAGTNSSSAVIRIRIGTTTLTGNIAATLTPPANALAVPGKIEGWLQIVADGAGGTARGNLQQFVHLAAVTITSAINPATGTVAVNTTTANQRVELTFISGNVANTYTFRGAVMYRVA